MNPYISGSRVLSVITILALVATFSLSFTSSASAQVAPPLVTIELPPGGSTEVEKEVTTPLIPQDPEICFLADTTGSMVSALANVQAGVGSIMTAVSSVQPSAEFCVAQYKDEGDTPEFAVEQDLTDDTGDVQAAMDSLSAAGGGDTPEAQLYALNELATGAASFDGPNRIIVWFGDASGHDPSIDGVTESDAITALQNADITVIAIPVDTGGAADGLDATGQATNITDETNGVLLPDATPDEVADAILAGIAALTTDVWPVIQSCDAGLSLSFDPEVHEDVAGGDTVSFEETIEVADDDSLQGQTLQCLTVFMANSYPDGGTPIGRQLVRVRVPDETPPLAQCVETTNPHGQTTPPAGSTTLPGPKGGQNEDGFYELVASDDETGIRGILVNGFGPFYPGDKVKVTETPGGKDKMQKMGSTNAGNQGQSDAIAAHLLLSSEPVMVAYDAAGNSTSASCLVPPPPK